jgi:hypothetical protein
MAAGLGFKTFTSGEVLTAADTNGYLMQGILVFANASARSAAVTSPQEGQYSYLKDTNALEYYDGAAWVGAPVGDITAVTAGTGISGGGSSGDVTITNSMATTIDAKGDLIAGTADNAFARLAVGNNGETLVADSSTSTGLRYTAGTVQSNPVLNSAMQVWQRGTSVAVTGNTVAYTTDRWQLQTAVAGLNTTISRQVTGDTTNLPNVQYCARVQRNSGVTANGFISFQYSQETINTIPFVGKTATLSFYVRAGANFSATSNSFGYQLRTGTGTDQNITAYTGVANPIDTTVTLTTTWQRVTATVAIPTSVTEMGINFYYLSTGTASTNDYFEVTGVQIDIGSVALPFRTYAATIQGELAACQRYLPASKYDTSISVIAGGYSPSTNSVNMIFPFPVQTRVAPTGLTLSSATHINWASTGNNAVTAGVFGYSSTLAGAVTLTVTATSGQAGFAYWNNASGLLLWTGCEL